MFLEVQSIYFQSFLFRPSLNIYQATTRLNSCLNLTRNQLNSKTQSRTSRQLYLRQRSLSSTRYYQCTFQNYISIYFQRPITNSSLFLRIYSSNTQFTLFLVRLSTYRIFVSLVRNMLRLYSSFLSHSNFYLRQLSRVLLNRSRLENLRL